MNEVMRCFITSVSTQVPPFKLVMDHGPMDGWRQFVSCSLSVISWSYFARNVGVVWCWKARCREEGNIANAHVLGIRIVERVQQCVVVELSACHMIDWYWRAMRSFGCRVDFNVTKIRCGLYLDGEVWSSHMNLSSGNV